MLFFLLGPRNRKIHSKTLGFRLGSDLAMRSGNAHKKNTEKNFTTQPFEPNKTWAVFDFCKSYCTYYSRYIVQLFRCRFAWLNLNPAEIRVCLCILRFRGPRKKKCSPVGKRPLNLPAQLALSSAFMVKITF